MQSTLFFPLNFRMRVVVLLLLLLRLAAAWAVEHNVTINTSHPVFVTSSKFLSWTMDAGETARWGRERTDFWTNATVRALAKRLGPSFFRYGGTSQDFTSYNFSGNYFPANQVDPTRPVVIMNDTVFDGLVDFVKAVNWDLIFGANLGTYRTAEGAWDPSAFQSLLEYAVSEKGYELAGWELGNEPDLFYKHNITITPARAMVDFQKFRQSLESVSAKGKVLGPDTALSPEHYLTSFLNNATAAAGDPGPLDIATYHFYYGPGSSRPHGLTWPEFHSPEVLDRFLTAATTTLDASKSWQNGSKSRALWVGETSSTYGGGTSNASASFVAGFMWLDKLALAARLRHSVVCRQVFGHAKYAAVGYDNVVR